MMTAAPAAMRIALAGASLADTAMEGRTLTQAAYWLLYQWRRVPDAFEKEVQKDALKRITHRMDENEHSAWQRWLALSPLDRPALT